ncbi:MAG: hypothetical protein OXH57_05930 [Ekhidna sp.]|nr:hypothetical protein [Ekhidna sp.]
MAVVINVIFLPISSVLCFGQETHIINEYLNDLKNVDCSVDSILSKYHKYTLSDSSGQEIFRTIYEEGKSTIIFEKIEIKYIPNESYLPKQLNNLVWNGHLYLFYSKKRGGKYLFPVLIRDNRIKGTIILNKGKSKCFFEV